MDLTQLPRQRLSPISEYPQAKGDATYERLLAGHFDDYRLEVTGLVERPLTLSLTELSVLEAEQVTMHNCIQGWRFDWQMGGGDAGRGPPSADRDRRRSTWPSTRRRASKRAANYYECIDIALADQPETILAYELNDEPLTPEHGVPLRLLLETKLGFKMVKFLRSIEVIEDYHTIGEGQGGVREDHQQYDMGAATSKKWCQIIVSIYQCHPASLPLPPGVVPARFSGRGGSALSSATKVSSSGSAGAVLGGEHLVGQRVQGVMDEGVVLLGAEDQADGRVLVGLGPVLLGVTQVDVHLAGVGVGELAGLDVNDDQATESAVVEEQVDPVPVVADAEPLLPAQEGEVAAEFQEEALEVQDQGLLELALGILVLQVQELQDQRVLDLLLGREEVLQASAAAPFRSIAALFREASVRS